jgi:hypothetical protein
MRKNSFISSFKQLPFSFFLSIVVFVGLQMMILGSDQFWSMCYHFSRISADDPIRFEAQLRMLNDQEDHNKILLMGSSQTREGFDVVHLNDQVADSDWEFFNLGVAGSAQPLDLFMTMEKIVRLKPKVVVYMTNLDSFYAKYKDNMFNQLKYNYHPKIWPYLWEYLGVKGVWDLRQELLESYLGQFSTPYLYRFQLARIMTAFVKDALGVEKVEEVDLFEYEEDQPPEYFDRMVEEGRGREISVNEYTPLNQYLFERFVQRLRSEGVDLLVLESPMHPQIGRIYDMELYEPFRTFLSQQAQNYNFHFLAKSQLPEFDQADFVDFSHLNRQGRAKMTQYLLAVIEPYLDNRSNQAIVTRVP